MGDNIVYLFIAGVVIWGLWRSSRPKRLFMVRLVDGVPQTVEGTVTPAFLEAVQEVAAAQKILQGTVSGYVDGAYIRLGFSAEFIKPSHQRLRNWWAVSGWSAAKADPVNRCG